MIVQEEILTRNKIIGVLLRSARLRAGESEASCAAVLSRDPTFIVQAEEGKVGLTLPQLESLAHHLGVSIAYLMGDEELPEAEPEPEPPPYADIMTIRRKIIGVILRQARLEMGRTLDDIAPAMGYTPEYLARVELGEAEISMIELDLLAQTLGIPFDRFVSEDVIPATVQDRVRLDLQRLEGLPPEVREFVLQPINTPYLQIAMNLSQMPSETLRQIASGLLEITY
jgi:transcriptional regulator with XRE-family HTH domain